MKWFHPDNADNHRVATVDLPLENGMFATSVHCFVPRPLGFYMKDEEYIARAIEGCVVGNGSKQISLLVEELGRIVAEVKYVRSQSFCPDMGEFSRGYQTACDEILERCKPYRRIQAGRMTIEHLAKRLADIERWVERREDYESEQREQS